VNAKADTIVAVATAPGSAGVGIVRVSGPQAVEVVQACFRAGDGRALAQQAPRLMVLGKLLDEQGLVVDEALVVRFEERHSFTGDVVVEVHAHGGSFHLQQVQAALLALSRALLPPPRLARAGEFTQRAFLNGRMDLTKAEAVADLIQSGSALGREAAARQLGGGLQRTVEALRQGVLAILAEAEAACDFPEEGRQWDAPGQWLARATDLRLRMQALLDTARTGRMLTQGVRVCLAGPPNAGKSSLLNALAGEERAIVSPEPGTTRDWLELRYQVQGLPVLLYDTAGLREAQGAIEAEGVRRTRRLAAEADLLLLVLDQSAPFDVGSLDVLKGLPGEALIVLNKNDLDPVWDSSVLRAALKVLHPDWASSAFLHKRVLSVSARQGAGLENLQARILDTALEGRAAETLEAVLLTRSRHEQALRSAAEALDQVMESLRANAAAELLAVDLRACLDALGEIVGLTTRAEVLEQIFSRFCIGK
jgi:tRNA modification GTPase